MSVALLYGDNGRLMRELSNGTRRFALAYLDPPFFTQQTWKTADGEVAFDDKWKSLDHYVAAITEAARAAFAVLLPEGSIVVHVDPETSHYLKVALDSALGRHRFASEIIWRYRRWPTPTKNFQQMHDVLLRYVVREPGVEWRWNQLYEPLSAKTIEWCGTQKQKAVKEEGKCHKTRRVRSSSELVESPGAALSDVWDMSIVAPNCPERTGYPTQKPEALLERLIRACTNEGDWVLEPFMGSATACAVAHRLGRHAVGIDSSPVAIRYARERLAPLLAQQSLFNPAGAT